MITALARRANHSAEMIGWIRARTEMSVLLSGFFCICISTRRLDSKHGTTKLVEIFTFVDGDKSGLQRTNPDDTMDSMDITNEWTKTKGIKGAVTEKQEYIVNGTTYKVDGKHVILCPTEQEREVAAILSGKYGKFVELVPQVVFPQGVQTPDYLIDGVRFDLKSPTGKGKNLLYGMIAKKKEQSHNFIIDITNCPLSMEELVGQADRLYGSWRTGFLEKLVFIKNGEIVKVLSRK